MAFPEQTVSASAIEGCLLVWEAWADDYHVRTKWRSYCAGAVAASRNAEVADAISSPFVNMWHDMERGAPILARHPRLCFGTLTALTAVGASYFWRSVHTLLAKSQPRRQ